VDEVNSYRCLCLGSFSGARCESDLRGVSLARAVSEVHVLPTLTVPTAAPVSQATRADVVRLTSMTAWVTGVHRTRPPV